MPYSKGENAINAERHPTHNESYRLRLAITEWLTMLPPKNSVGEHGRVKLNNERYSNVYPLYITLR